jgi:hypothetical protein
MVGEILPNKNFSPTFHPLNTPLVQRAPSPAPFHAWGLSMRVSCLHGARNKKIGVPREDRHAKVLQGFILFLFII